MPRWRSWGAIHRTLGACMTSTGIWPSGLPRNTTPRDLFRKVRSQHCVVTKGGSWLSTAAYCRSAMRTWAVIPEKRRGNDGSSCEERQTRRRVPQPRFGPRWFLRSSRARPEPWPRSRPMARCWSAARPSKTPSHSRPRYLPASNRRRSTRSPDRSQPAGNGPGRAGQRFTSCLVSLEFTSERPVPRRRRSH